MSDMSLESTSTFPTVHQSAIAATVSTPTTLPTINHRVLLSLREGAKVIGTKGSTIQRIREANHVKIGLSERQPGCSDRVLSCAGRIADVSNALGDIVDVLNDYDSSHDSEGNPVLAEKFSYHFLNPILPPPSKGEIKDSEQLKNIGSLRLLVTNSQLSSIIGKGGARIKALIEKHGVKIVASRDFLPDSDERILEMQGFPGSISIALMEISEILLNEIDINFGSETRYYPHLRSQKTPKPLVQSQSRSQPYSNINSNVKSQSKQIYEKAPTVFDNTTNDYDDLASARSADEIDNPREFKVIVNIPELYVGAIVGRQGNRIANLRKFSKTKIVVEKKDENSTQDRPRAFTIIGDLLKNVKLAETMLLRNLDAEVEKRQERNRSKFPKGDAN